MAKQTGPPTGNTCLGQFHHVQAGPSAVWTFRSVLRT